MESMRTRIIAEAAQGYEGRRDYCELYVRAAAKAGADAIKFQCVYADDVAEPNYEYYDFFKTLQMNIATWQWIRDLASELDVQLFTDISGERALETVKQVGPDAIKIHSTSFFNRPLIKQAFDTANQVFISIGGIREAELDRFMTEIDSWNVMDRTILLYGFQAEPTPIEKSNLSRLPLLKQRFPRVQVGYLDHAAGESEDQIHLSLCAMSLGVDWIEKHITLSRYLEIEDFASALQPDEFETYIATIRRLETAFGPATTELSAEEEDYRDRAVKKLLAQRDLPAGHTLEFSDLDFKRTSRICKFQGFHDPHAVIGRTLKAAVSAGEPLLDETLS
jgi:N,N'-diacetyllegionaminate synthase